jgi:RNA-binding protein
MPALDLTPKERQALKARSHALKPVVLLGASGLTEAVIKEIDRALTAHELVKVKVPGDDRAEREAMFAKLADQLSAAPVQIIGKLLVFYRPAPKEPERASPAASRRPAADGRRPRRR